MWRIAWLVLCVTSGLCLASLVCAADRTVTIPADRAGTLTDVASERKQTEDEVLQAEVTRTLDRLAQDRLTDQLETIRRYFLALSLAERAAFIASLPGGGR